MFSASSCAACLRQGEDPDTPSRMLPLLAVRCTFSGNQKDVNYQRFA